MSNLSNIDISHYKVKSLSSNLEPNSVYYVLDQSNNIVKGYITDKAGVAIPLFTTSGGGTGTVESVIGTGVTGTATNPRVDIATFVSNQLGNLVKLSTVNGKLVVNPITSPNTSIDIVSTATELQLQLSASIQTQINSAIQPGDNVSELINDGDGTSPFITHAEFEAMLFTDYSKVVYVNDVDPTTATIFDLDNPPVTNDDLLKTDVNNLYIGLDASTWVYNNNTFTYETKVVATTLSNFYLEGTTVDAGNTKTAPIERVGTVGVGIATAPNHAVRKDQLDLKEDKSNKGINNGYASLDSGGKVPISQLPNSIMEYQGVYNASTNIPTLVNGIGNTGDVYKVAVAGSGVNGLGFIIGDYVIYNGTTWEKAHSGADVVNSVNGYTGVVILNADDIDDTSTTHKFVTSTEKTIWNGKQDALISGTNIKTLNGVSLLGSGDIPSQIIITTSTNITTSTTDGSGNTQNGRNVIIDNGSSNINLTCNGGVTASYLKHGTGVITFIRGSGRALIYFGVNTASVAFSGTVGSRATITQVGTTDYLAISND